MARQSRLAPKSTLRPIWQIILAVFAALSIPIIIFLLKGDLDFRTDANPTETPLEIVVSNITDTSATISFETKTQKTTAVVNYGIEQNSLNQNAIDERKKYDSNSADLYKLHYHKLINLSPSTTYFFSITVGGQTYTDPNYKFTTLSTSSNTQVPSPINGTVEGDSFEEGIVYIHLKKDDKRSTIISELLPSNGNFAINLTSATDEAGNIFVQNYTQPDIYLFVNAADKGKGSTKITQISDTPNITLNTLNPIQYSPAEIETALEGETSPTPTPTGNSNNSQIDEVSKKLTHDFVSTEDKDLIAPRNISISNIASNGFTVSWTTQTPTTGAVAYGKTAVPNLKTIDKRDTETEKIQRYTHYVEVFSNDFTAGDTISFLIISQEKEYINNEEYFKYQIKIPPQAPSPETIEGKIIPGFSPTNTNKDFLVLFKTADSTWISSIVNDSLNWSISTAGLLSRTTFEPIIVGSSQQLEYKIYGEKNATHSQTITFVPDEIINTDIEQGLTIRDINNNSQIAKGEVISGTFQPNGNLKIKIGETIDQAVQANANRSWTYEIPDNAPTGEQNIVITTEVNTIDLDVEVQGANPQPSTTPTTSITPKQSPSPTQISSPSPTATLADTAISPIYTQYLISFAVIMIGWYLLKLQSKET